MAIKKNKVKTKAKSNSSKSSSSKEEVDVRMADILAKKYGKMKIYTKENELKPIEKISTGLIELDDILGGGIPRGRIVEIYGSESSGKTSFTLSVAAQFQKQGLKVAFMDAEQALDVNYCRAVGFDDTKALVVEPETGNDALNASREIIESGMYDLLIIDSTAALVHENELDGEIGDSHMALRARLIDQFVRFSNGPAKEKNVTVLVISQMRANPGAVGHAPKKNATGGNALKFYSSLRLSIARVGSFKQGDTIIGNDVKVKAVKNKSGGAQFAECTTSVRFGEGYCRYYDLINVAVKEGVIFKGGAWFSYGEEKLGQGKENVRTKLKNSPELFDEIKNKIMDQRVRKKEELQRLVSGIVSEPVSTEIKAVETKTVEEVAV